MKFTYMIDWYVWSSVILFFLVLGIPIAIGISFFYRIYITRKYLDQMMAEIKSSPDLSSTMKVYASLGVMKKILIPGLLHGAVSEPRFLSIGFISVSDVQNFPSYFRRILSRDNLFQRIGTWWFISVALLSFVYMKVNSLE